MRTTLLYLSRATWSRRIITRWRLSRRVASRFIAGDTLDEGIAAVRAHNAAGLYVTLDHLGEHVSNSDEARRAAQDYLVLMDKIIEAGVRSNASLKLSQLGLGVDYDLCLSTIRQIVQKAEERDLFVRIDMEDSSTVDRTFQLYRSLRAEGLRRTGLVIQAYLYRSEADVRALMAEGCPIRLCKGAYKEPADRAFQKKKDVDSNYDKLARLMMDASKAAGAPAASADGHLPPLVALATHDERRITAAREYAAKIDLPKRALEFQMLNGIRSDLQKKLAADGYPVRVYVPYGTEWYPYFMRRLAERPANVWFFVSNFFRS